MWLHTTVVAVSIVCTVCGVKALYLNVHVFSFLVLSIYNFICIVSMKVCIIMFVIITILLLSLLLLLCLSFLLLCVFFIVQYFYYYH